MLLAVAAIYNPAILVGYLLYLYGPSNSCVLGGLCSFGSFPRHLAAFAADRRRGHAHRSHLCAALVAAG